MICAGFPLFSRTLSQQCGVPTFWLLLQHANATAVNGSAEWCLWYFSWLAGVVVKKPKLQAKTTQDLIHMLVTKFC